MSQHNNNSAQVQAFKDYQAISDETFDTLYRFEYWVKNEWSWDEGPLPQTEEDMIVVIQDAINKYLMQDDKSQALIKAGEQELLKKWSENAKNL